MRRNRICLITPAHLASNPRLVKEANALYQAGFDVKVIAGDSTAEVRPLDAAVIKNAPWPIKQVKFGNRATYYYRRAFQKLKRFRFSQGQADLLTAINSHSINTALLAREAARQPADLYIAHYLSALPAAAAAADRNSAKFGFDIEDDHIAELPDAPENQLELSIRRKIEEHFLPRCISITAASPGIAKSYRDRYGVSALPILNVFPLAHVPACRMLERRTTDLAVYWFSQTIGPERGLEQLITALGKTKAKVRLVIRGSDFLGYSKHLASIAARCARPVSLEFLASEPPDEMVRLASKYDVGFAGELNKDANRNICLTNKIFVYLLAGVAVLLSDTAAQRELAHELGEGAQLVDLDDAEGIAACLDRWATDPHLLAVAKRKAAQLGQTRFNWDLEREKFLQHINHALRSYENSRDT